MEGSSRRRVPSEEPLTLTFRFSEPVSIKEIEIYNAVDNERFSRNHHRIHYLDFAADDLDLVMLTELADDNVVGSWTISRSAR